MTESASFKKLHQTLSCSPELKMLEVITSELTASLS